MQLRVLIVDSDPEDLLFIEDVLIEIEEGRHWSSWTDVETVAASSCSEALASLARETADVILLNLNLSDTRGATTFRAMQAIAPGAPIVLMVASEDRGLAGQLIREGAQDFLIKKELDCGPLAHSIRNAIERQRSLTAARSAAATDSLTGLLNRGAFFTLAERDRKLAQAFSRRLLIMVAEPKHLRELAAANGDHRRDLAMVAASEVLRELAGPTGLVGRLDENRIAMALFDSDTESVEAAWARIHSTAGAKQVGIGAAIFEPAAPVALELLLECAGLDLGHTPPGAAALTAHATPMRR